MRYLALYGFLAICCIACKKDDDMSPGDDDDGGNGTLSVETEWIKTYGGSLDEEAMAVTGTPDGGVAVLGFTRSTDGDITGKAGNDQDLWLLRLNAEGELLWEKTYGGSDNDIGTGIVAVENGGFVMSGYVRSDDGDISENGGFFDSWVAGLDASGNIQWEKTYGYAGDDQAHGIIPTSEGGYFLTGYLDVTASEGAGNEDGEGKSSEHGVGEFWGIKIHAAGELQWSRYFGGTDNDRSYDVVQTPDSRYIMVGNTESDDFDISENKGSYDYWAVCVDGGGNLVWENTYGGSDIEIAYSILKTAGGDYLIGGDSRSADQDVTGSRGNADAWIVKIDGSGSMLWQQSYGGSAFDTVRGLVELPDGKIFGAGTSRSSDVDVSANHGESDFWLFVTDPDGTLLWEQNFGGSGFDFANASVKTADNDGGVVIVGSTNSADHDVSENKGGLDIMIIKLTFN